ncbi:ATP-binding cassette domain-containing protein [Phycicoccus sp. MAQZ13P-2]|uniref:ATP-binding cassette domain-containing protein n=1 Tax=Phycicoccus mangrovi TaxID=2840470 RepID=UPI001BFFFB5C|nr:ATP-binding cassette domain-containing protein [Phycicoccus mangrovi]MBT9256647.1 ATP-binding cassette domain-containing protein [Phycicoccus mangrovi]MBT9274789.1 ATP-binding cassette domain-containing protein [Phycicoccus mangrovi]
MRRGHVEVAGLTWRPVGRREPVLRDVTLTLRPGERVLLAGASGAGKSTLLRALTGMLGSLEPGDLEGDVTLDGAAPGDRPGAVGLVLQEPGSGVVAASVGRDVAFGLENVGADPAGMPAVVERALAAVGLADLPLDTPTSALSGGQTQRLALAGTLALDPSLVLLDEPTAMLDPACAAEVRAAVAALSADDPRTLVVVEHVLGPWVPLVDRLVVLSTDGRVVADGPVEEVLATQREVLLAMGLWVPDEPAPAPLDVDPGLLAALPPTAGAALTADPLAVDRTVRLVDGSTRTLRAAALDEPLAASPGDLSVLVGPSGSGKSTVLAALAGFLDPVPDDAVRLGAGEGAADPRRLDAPALAARLAWVPQWASSTLVAGTVLDEVLATSRALGRQGPAEEARALALLDALGLAALAAADPRHLSGGEQRRLAVAAALHHGPPVLLADEPTVGQDRHTWAAIVGLVAAHRAAGGAVVAATHDAEVVARADRVHHLAAPPRPPQEPSTRVPLAARCGPLALLAGAMLGIPAGVVSPRWSTSLAVLAVQAVLAVVALAAPGTGPAPGGRARRVLLRTVPGALAALSTGWSTWWLAGHDVDTALTVALRVLVIVVPSAVLLPWVDPDRLGDHLAQRLHLPDRPVVATAAALQRVHTFGAVWTEIGRARRVRGLGVRPTRPAEVARHLAASTTGLLVRTLGAAVELAVAMDARGFATARRRTWWAPAPWRLRDTVLLVAAALPVAAAVLVR